MLDQVDNATFIAGAKAVRTRETSALNQVLLDLNIVFYELLSVAFFHPLPDDVHGRIMTVFSQLETLPLPLRAKKIITVFNVENLAQYVNLVRLHHFHDLSLHFVSKQRSLSSKLRADQDRFHQLHQDLNDRLLALYAAGEETNDGLLKGHAILVRARYLMSMEFDLYGQSPTLPVFESHDRPDFVQSIDLTLYASDLFLEAGYPDQSHYCLYCALELITIRRLRYQYTDNYDQSALEMRLREMEQAYELEPTEFYFKYLVDRIEKLQAEKETRYMYGRYCIFHLFSMTYKQKVTEK